MSFRQFNWFAAPVAVCLILAALCATARAERPPTARLLPDNTVVMVTLPDAPNALERFMNTAMGRMSQDPQLKPLVKHLYGSLAEFVAEFQERVDLSLEEMVGLPRGEITFAVIGPKDAKPMMLVILDAKEQIGNLRKLLEKGTAALEAQNATKTKEEIGGIEVQTYELPGRGGRTVNKVTFFEKDSVLVAGSDLDAVKAVLAKWNGEKAETLADNFAYNGVMNRCKLDKEMPPQAVWFADPIGLARSIGVGNAGMTIALAMLPSLGLDAFSGLGGVIALDAGQFDNLSHSQVLMASPREGALKMIAFEPVDLKAERWAPADAATYTTMNWNVDKSLKAASEWYDALYGKDALNRLVQRFLESRLGVDFEKDILPELDGRVTLTTRVEKPVTMASQQQLIAVKLKNVEPIEKALEKVQAKFGEMMKTKEYNGKKFYVVEIPERPRPEGAPPPPQPGFAVIDGYLMACDRYQIIEKIVLTLADGKSLNDELDFKLVVGRLKRQAGDSKPAMISFNRPQEGFRYMYELAQTAIPDMAKRQGERNRFLRTVGDAVEKNPLPPFAVIERYLAPAGAMLIDDETGLHYSSFTLRRKAE